VSDKNRFSLGRFRITLKSVCISCSLLLIYALSFPPVWVFLIKEPSGSRENLLQSFYAPLLWAISNNHYLKDFYNAYYLFCQQHF